MEKSQFTKITQLLPQDENRGVLGLGDDSKVYEWSYLQGKWFEFKKGAM